MEENVHVKFDEFRTKDYNIDDREVEELTEDNEITQGVEVTHAEPVDEPGPLDIIPDIGSHTSNESEGNSDVDREEEIIRKAGWKHQSLHPLDNLIFPQDSGIETRSKARNLVAYSTFISLNEPKSIKEALKDPDWLVYMQEKLHQFERSKV